MTINTNNAFSWKSKSIIFLLFLTFTLHLVWATFFPISNMEAYYWDWSRTLQWGYFDHPGAVSWISKIGTVLFGDNPFGARFFICVFHLLGILFLIKIMEIIQEFRSHDLSYNQVLFIIFLANFIPVIGVTSFLLMPDTFLNFFTVGSLYFALKFLLENKKNNFISFKNIILFSVFSGLNFNTKYHAIPIFFIFLFSIIISLQTKKKIKFLVALASCFVCLLFALPTILWNYTHDWVSILFQINHGYGGMKNIQLFDVFRYITEGSIYLTPWLYLICIIMVIKYIFKFKENDKYLIIFYLSFLSIFSIFLLASFISYVHPYWNAIGFYIMLPLVAVSVDFKKILYFRFWIYFSTVTLLTTITLLCITQIRHFIVEKSHGQIGYRTFMWDEFTEENIFRLTGIQLSDFGSPIKLTEKNCQQSGYILGSLDWEWIAQIAFHFPSHPFVYNFNRNEVSFYTFRDEFKKFGSCKIIILGKAEKIPKDLPFNFEILQSKTFYLPNFPNIPISLVLGKMKEPGLDVQTD